MMSSHCNATFSAVSRSFPIDSRPNMTFWQTLSHGKSVYF